MTYRKQRPDRRATAAVEFAVIASLILAPLTAGMLEVTRAIQVKCYLTDAVRSACRHAAVPGCTTASVKSAVDQVLTNNKISAADATVTTKVFDSKGTFKTNDVSLAVQNDRISVQVSIPLSKVGWVSPIIFSNQSITSETLVMLRQG